MLATYRDGPCRAEAEARTAPAARHARCYKSERDCTQRVRRLVFCRLRLNGAVMKNGEDVVMPLRAVRYYHVAQAPLRHRHHNVRDGVMLFVAASAKQKNARTGAVPQSSGGRKCTEYTRYASGNYRECGWRAAVPRVACSKALRVYRARCEQRWWRREGQRLRLSESAPESA